MSSFKRVFNKWVTKNLKIKKINRAIEIRINLKRWDNFGFEEVINEPIKWGFGLKNKIWLKSFIKF